MEAPPPAAPKPESPAEPQPGEDPAAGGYVWIGPDGGPAPPPWSEVIPPSRYHAHRRRFRRYRGLRATARRAVLAGAIVALIVVILPEEPGDRTQITRHLRSGGLSTGDQAVAAGQQASEAGASSHRRLRLERRIGGEISPKSVMASGTGLVFAQNMMYRHTVTVYGRDHRRVKTIPDSVELAEVGFPDYSGTYRGAPVEAAFSPDGRYGYVSNYKMSGPGFDNPGDDVCSPSQRLDRSFLYRIPLSTLNVDKAIRVGSVPKYVAVTPDNRTVLASNWCSWDLSVIDAPTGRSVRSVPIGAYPRGIAVDPDSEIAYVAVMGSSDVAKVDLSDFSVSWIRGVGAAPRDLVMDSRGRYLYATLNRGAAVAKVDLRRRRVVETVRTGKAPRSAAIAPDGRSLYVVNYLSNTVSKVRTRDMKVVQTLKADKRPIGVTYEAETGEVWVACYSGSIMVFRDA
jgi:YVTN family beta-propeller protein